MNLDAKRLALFDALLSGGDLRRIVEAAASILGNPIAICDMGLGTIAISPDLSGDPEWDAPNTGMDAPDVRQATLTGDFRKVYASDKTVVGDYRGAKQRYLAARIRRKSHVLGHALVLERNKPFTEEDQKLLPEICRTIGFVLAPETDVDQLAERHGRLFLDILEGRLRDASVIEARTRSAQLSLPDRMMLLLFRPASESAQIPARHLRERLRRVFPRSMGIVRGDDVVLVVDAYVATFEEGVASAVSLNLTAVGASYPFTNLGSLQEALDQAEAAIRLGSTATAPAEIIRYEEVVAQHLAECAATIRRPESFEHPALALLDEAGARDNAAYTHDLAAYLSCGRNASAAAKALHIHKNTMYYRLQRISEIAHVDLTDPSTCFALQLGIAMRNM